VEGRKARRGSQSHLGGIMPQNRGLRKCQSGPRFRRAIPRRRRHASGSLPDRPGRNLGARLSEHDARTGWSV